MSKKGDQIMSKIMEEDVGKFSDTDMETFSEEVANLLNYVQGENIYKAYPEYGTIFVFKIAEIIIPAALNMSPGRTRIRLNVEKALSVNPSDAETNETWAIIINQHIEAIPLHHFKQEYSFKLKDAKSNLVQGLAHMLERAKEIDNDHYREDVDDYDEDSEDD